MHPSPTPLHVRSTVAILVAVTLMSVAPTVALGAIANDHPDQATIIAALPYSETQDTSGATDSPEDPQCSGDGHSVWFSFTPGATVAVSAYTFGSDFDTTLSVYTDDGTGLTQVACNDDAGSLQSQVFWTAETDVTYLIMAGSFGDTPGGNLVLTVHEGSPPPPPPPAIEVTVSVTGATFDAQTGQATVTGEIVCSEFALGFLSAQLRQRVGRGFVIGFIDVPVVCDQEPTAWSATTFQQIGTFRGGMVHIAGSAIVFDGAGGTLFEADTTMRVNR